MFDLLLIFFAVVAPQLLVPLGVPGDIMTAVHVATLLVWPGYVASLLFWPKVVQSHIGLKLALTPFLSVLIVMSVSLFCWAANLSVALENIGAITSVLVVAMLGVLAIMRLKSRKKDDGRILYQEIVGAFSVFAALALLAGMSAIGPEPQQASVTPSLTIYVDPESSPTYDYATDTWQVPLVVVTGNAAGRTTVEITAAVYGREALSGLVGISPGEETRVSMDVPAQYLSQSEASPIDIQAHLAGLSDGPALRVWLNR
jgi:hypothetical protein